VTLMHRLRAVLAAAFTAVLLAGCYDTDMTIQVDAQGQATASLKLGFDKEMEDVFKAVQLFGKMDTNENGRLIENGLCNALSSDNPALPMPKQLASRQYAANNRFYCEFFSPQKFKITDIDPIMSLGAMQIDAAKSRELTININLDRLPDLTPLLGIGVMSELERRQAAGQLRPGVDPDELTRTMIKAMIAFNAISMRGRKVRMAVTAPRIVSTTGVKSADGKTASFEWTAEEFGKLWLDKDARAGKKYSLTLAYR
jgi:hypothetical protein